MQTFPQLCPFTPACLPKYLGVSHGLSHICTNDSRCKQTNYHSRVTQLS